MPIIIIGLLFSSLTLAATPAGSLPGITAFTAAPAKVLPGQSSTLNWSVKGATTLTIKPGIGAVNGTSYAVKPSATTAYTLTAVNAFGSANASVTVMVGSPPTITGFKATPANVVKGQSTTLSWTVTGSPTLAISAGVGAVSGTSVVVKPTTMTTYILTATNPFGSATAPVTVMAGSPPTIGNFKATPATVTAGQSSTLSWAVTGSPVLTINQGIGGVNGTSFVVRPASTKSYTLTATSAWGSVSASVTVVAGSAPGITSFTATPAAVAPGQSSTLNWAVTGSPGLMLNPGIGPVTGTSVKVSPSTTTTYTLAATNSFGTTRATVTVAAGALPVINSFSANPNMAAGPGVSAILTWSTTGASGLSIDHGVGTVTGNSVKVSPGAATTYTLTATNPAGKATATATVSYMPLITVDSQLYYSEHAIYIIPPAGQVTWTGSASWNSVYSAANVDSYLSTLNGLFKDDYVFLVVAANQLAPNNVPQVQPARHVADGIGLGSTGVGVPSICRYNIGGGTVGDGAFGVLDHEIGHIWGVFLQPAMSDANGHWLPDSTATGQMAGPVSDDGYTTVKQLSGDPLNGFRWTGVDNISRNETETFSGQDLYLQGLASTFPDLYVLTAPVYNPDHTVSYSSFIKYDQAWMVQKYGARNPSYRTSVKRFRTGFVYVARDQAEVLAVYQPIERSINHFVNAEQIDTARFRFQVPFLVNTQYRASLDALLQDLDGNAAPTLVISGSAGLNSSDGTAVVPFKAADADGPAPAVSCVPAAANCSISGSNIVLTGLPPGANFFTIKAQDAGGKKTFAHFVMDVQ